MEDNKFKISKKSKIIILSLSIVVALLILIVSIVAINNHNKKDGDNIAIESDEKYEVSKLNRIMDTMVKNKNYYFQLLLNKENYKTIYRKGDALRVILSDEGKQEEYVIKNGNTYVLTKNETYKDNTSMLNTLENNLEDLKMKKFTLGKEVINDKEYIYEEYSKVYSFLINYKGKVDYSKTKTRFYFDGDELKYIKTYVGDIEQLLQVNLELGNQEEIQL